MNLIQPYGDGNHRRIKWRQAWDVDKVALTATHQPTGFKLSFSHSVQGEYSVHLPKDIRAFGPFKRRWTSIGAV